MKKIIFLSLSILLASCAVVIPQTRLIVDFAPPSGRTFVGAAVYTSGFAIRALDDGYCVVSRLGYEQPYVVAPLPDFYAYPASRAYPHASFHRLAWYDGDLVWYFRDGFGGHFYLNRGGILVAAPALVYVNPFVSYNYRWFDYRHYNYRLFHYYDHRYRTYNHKEIWRQRKPAPDPPPKQAPPRKQETKPSKDKTPPRESQKSRSSGKSQSGQSAQGTRSSSEKSGGSSSRSSSGSGHTQNGRR